MTEAPLAVWDKAGVGEDVGDTKELVDEELDGFATRYARDLLRPV